MHTQKVYFIFWSGTDHPFLVDYMNGIERFAQDVAHDAGASSNAYGAIQQYGVSNDFEYGGAVIDTTHQFPTSPGDCPAGYPTVCVTDQDVINEIAAVQSSNGWSGGLVNQFVLVLPPNVVTCFDAAGAVCSNNKFCAYHSWYHYQGSSTPYVYINLPYEGGSGGCHTSDGHSTEPEPNGVVDVELSPLSHEEREAATDPTGRGWWDANGNEADDKCYITWGSAIGQTGGSIDYNQLINGDPYETQTEWSNAQKGCVQKGPAVITSLSPNQAADGQTIDINLSNFTLAAGATTTVVTFNGHQTPSVVIDSPTKITALVPSGNTGGKVTVTDLGGVATSTQTFGPAPAITSLTDALGGADSHDFTGKVIVVHGTGFFGVRSVKFNGVPASFSAVASDGTSLKTVVPTSATTGPVTVTTAAGGVSAGSTFTVKPTITSFTPTSAKGLSNVAITGTGLAGATEVDFNGDASHSIVSDTATKIVAQVPGDATPGAISVGNGTDVADSGTKLFTPLPSITGLSVVDGQAGDPVVITGADLSDVQTVKFGTFAQAVVPVSATEVDAIVPSAPFSTGKVTVVTSTGKTAVSSQTFTITKVTGATASAAAGATITITGAGLSDAQTVDFPGVSGMLPSSKSATSVKVTVPSGATAGDLFVNMPNGQHLETPKPFKPLPRITTFLPGASANPATAGQIVTVSGTNLEGPGPTTVKIGSVVVPADHLGAVGPLSFSLTIPDNAVTGTVSYTNGNGTTVSPTALFIKPTIDSLTGTNDHGIAGDKITLTGKTFTGTKSVHFGADTHSAPFVVGAGGTSLTVTIPTTALSGVIAVTNAGGSAPSDNFVADPVIKSFSPTSAPVGGTITVTGTGLADADLVTFGGGWTAIPTPLSATSLRVVVPAGASSHQIGVHTVSGGDADPSAASLTITFSVTDFSPAAAPAGQSVTLNGVGLTGVTEVDFNGNPGTGLSVNGAGTQITVTPDLNPTGVITIKKGTTTSIQAPGAFALLQLSSASDVAGAVGSVFTLVGTGFSAVTDVKFGSISALFSKSQVNQTDTQLTITVPSGATGDHLTLTVPGATLDVPFTVETDFTGLVINEIAPGTSGAFIELKNSGSDLPDLNGLKLVYIPGTATDASAEQTTTLDSRAAVGHNSWYSDPVGSLGAASLAGGALALELPDGTVIDSVAWGTVSSFVSANFGEGTPAAAAGSGDSIARSPDGTDTNDNSADFAVTTTLTPDAANVITP